MKYEPMFQQFIPDLVRIVESFTKTAEKRGELLKQSDRESEKVEGVADYDNPFGFLFPFG